MGLLLGKDISPLSFNGKDAHLILFFSLVMLLKLLPLSGENLHENKREDLVFLSSPLASLFFALIYAFLHLTKMLTNL